MTKLLRQLNRHLLELLIWLFLIVVTFAVFWQVQNQEFINYDDNVYITENPHVLSGLTRKSLAWAFTSTYASNWHPLTWLSHLLDCELYGLNPKWHHLINLFLHAANTLLLFLVLKRSNMTLFKHALSVTANNYLVHSNMGVVIVGQGKLDDGVGLSTSLIFRLANGIYLHPYLTVYRGKACVTPALAVIKILNVIKKPEKIASMKGTSLMVLKSEGGG